MNLKHSGLLLSVILAITFVTSFTDGRYLLVELNDEDDISDSGIKLIENAKKEKWLTWNTIWTERLMFIAFPSGLKQLKEWSEVLNLISSGKLAQLEAPIDQTLAKYLGNDIHVNYQVLA